MSNITKPRHNKTKESNETPQVLQGKLAAAWGIFKKSRNKTIYNRTLKDWYSGYTISDKEEAQSTLYGFGISTSLFMICITFVFSLPFLVMLLGWGVSFILCRISINSFYALTHWIGKQT